jgi:excisionase family DNA binding protein
MKLKIYTNEARYREIYEGVLNMATNKLVHVRTAAITLCCTERHIYDMIKDGKIKAIRLGPRGLRVVSDSVKAYIKKNVYKQQ